MNTPTIRQIQDIVAQRFGITRLDLISDRRGRLIARPRQVAMWVARHTTLHSLPAIGEAFRRDHTTVMAGIARIDLVMANDPAFAATVNGILAAVDCGDCVERRRAMIRLVA